MHKCDDACTFVILLGFSSITDKKFPDVQKLSVVIIGCMYVCMYLWGFNHVLELKNAIKHSHTCSLRNDRLCMRGSTEVHAHQTQIPNFCMISCCGHSCNFCISCVQDSSR